MIEKLNLNLVELNRALAIAEEDQASWLVTKIEKLIAAKNKANSLRDQKVWIDSDQAYYIGVTVASGTFTGLGGSWFNRTVKNITSNEIYSKQGEIKVNRKVVAVVLDEGNRWRIA